MKQNFYSYQNYRVFFADFLENKGMNQTDFLQHYASDSCRISRMTLSRILKKKPNGQYKARIKDDVWLSILEAIRLNSKQKDFLLVLKMFNDASEDYPENHPTLKSYKRVLQKVRSVSKISAPYSKNALLIAEAFEKLTGSLKGKLIKSVIQYLEQCEQGQKKYSIDQNIRQLRQNISRIIK